MDKMPYQPEREVHPLHLSTSTLQTPISPVITDWRHGLPALVGRQVVLRELRLSDDGSICALLTTE